jgi:hypothetical protein
MTKVAFFNVDEKEQAILSKEFTGAAGFELRFHQKSLGFFHGSLTEYCQYFIRWKGLAYTIRLNPAPAGMNKKEDL